MYGVGLKKSDSSIKDPSQWQGLNLLGKSLTNLRYHFTLQLKNDVKVQEQVSVSKQNVNKP